MIVPVERPVSLYLLLISVWRSKEAHLYRAFEYGVRFIFWPLRSLNGGRMHC